MRRFTVTAQQENTIFVLRNRILSACPYVLGEWSAPDRKVVQTMANTLRLPACAMDVAVLESGRTVLLEVHPFIWCGLYGFEGPDLLKLAKVAWVHQIRKNFYDT